MNTLRILRFAEVHKNHRYFQRVFMGRNLLKIKLKDYMSS